MAIKLLELELTEKLRPISEVKGYQGLKILGRHRGKPIGWISLDVHKNPFISVEQLHQAITEQLGWQLIPETLGEFVVPKPQLERSWPPISVVVCTRDRTNQLQLCLQALAALDYPEYEIVIIDNAPTNDLTARLAAQMEVRYVREDRLGLDWARNRGITEAHYDIIAYTDDDTRADRLWLKAIAIAFAKPEIMAVTGLIAPMELETTAQIYFEHTYGGMSKGFKRREIRRSGIKKEQLLWASSYGAGANMAFRRELFAKVGLFDVALDVGTPTRGGGDIEFFHRVAAQGYVLVYEPAALVWHQHRRDFDSLRRQIRDNGSGFGAYLMTCWRNRTVRRRSLLRFALHNWFWEWIFYRLWRPKKHWRRLVLAELQGLLSSPWAYRRALQQARRLAALKPKDHAPDNTTTISTSNGNYTAPFTGVEQEAGTVA